MSRSWCLALFLAVAACAALVACADPVTEVAAPPVQAPVSSVTVICPSGPAPYCVQCQVYNVHGTCAESSCAENAGWVGNLNCDPFDCSHGYWWCEYALVDLEKDTVLSFFVECDSNVPRGQEGSCRLRSEALSDLQYDFTVVSQIARSADTLAGLATFRHEYAVGETYPGGLNGQEHVWSGTFVAKTAVRFEIQALGKQYAAAGTFEPAKRTWPAMVASPPSESFTTHDQLPDVPIRDSTVVGLFDVVDSVAFTGTQSVAGIFEGGPNDSLWYFTEAPSISTRVLLHPRLQNGSSFFILQDSVLPPGDTIRNCGQPDAVAYRNRVREHEGMLMQTSSHWSVFDQALRGNWRYLHIAKMPTDSLPVKLLERRLVKAAANAPSIFLDEAFFSDWRPFRERVAPHQHQFDIDDRPSVNNWGTCRPVWEQP